MLYESGRPTRHVAGVPQNSAFATQDNDCGKALNVELLSKGVILCRLSGGQRRTTGKIDFDQDEVVVGEAAEFRCAQDFGVQLLAPATPIGAGEEEKDSAVLLPR